ncbi:MAG: class I SAM-dependent DNA methyltransferase [Nevskiaceae bacterium]
MPLSWNEIKDRAFAFSREWADEARETAEAQTFWNQFFEVFGVTRRRVATFEEPVRRLGERRGEIDLFWKGTLIAEHKSRGRNLDKAFDQALDYFPGIPERDLPRYVLVSDFAKIRLHDLESGKQHEFPITDLHKNVKLFGFIAGYRVQEIKPEDPVNLKAAEKMGRLHDRLKGAGYSGHALEMLLVRLLFCMFADDTGIFQPAQSFRLWLETRTQPDGSDLGSQLAHAFQILNLPADQRPRNLEEQLAAFPYVNGRLFEEHLPIASFSSAMREALLDCCALDWSLISPAIFGALFQSIMDEEARRNLGAHYTSEQNILKVIKPLFLDELWAEFERVRGNRNRLFDFHKKLRTLTFFDPACGCGNFLVVAYRELRKLELELLRAARQSGQRVLDVHQLTQIDVDQFYGIEIEEFPAQIAQVALWLTDHQMNELVGEEFGMYFARIPLKASPNIVHGDALTLDWDAVLPRERAHFVFGNPPFIGKQYQSPAQKADFARVMRELPNFGVLDFVTAWYVKAAHYLSRPASLFPGEGMGIRCAFVSTNSISQGEQVGVLWSWLLGKGLHIHFAHRTFEWNNEARGVAGVHCVIVGFGLQDNANKVIYDYVDIAGEPHAVPARNINPYLVDAPDVVLPNRAAPICQVPEIAFGSMPNDGGHLLLSADEKRALVANEPAAARWIRPFLGSEEFINGSERWCLWLVDTPPDVLRTMPSVATRVAKVREHRLDSRRPTTIKLANVPRLFGEIRQPVSDYLLIPSVSSERRTYAPIGFMPAATIASNLVFVVSSASRFHFGAIASAMHMAWVRAVCGRLESRYRYSAGIVYNNFPWPVDATEQHKSAIEKAVRDVLDSRTQFPNSSLADLYDPLTMPPELLRAHLALDRAVDAAYLPSGGKRTYVSDAERVAFLFELYQKLTSLLPSSKPKKTRRGRQRRGA